MRALRVEEHGGPEQIRLGTASVPTPGPGEALVRVAYAGVNFMDVYTREGRYRRSRAYSAEAPLTLGMEAAGTVVEAPDGSSVSPGDRVAWCLVWGSAAEYALVPVDRLVPVPDAVPLELAAATIFPGVTAAYLVDDVARLSSGTTCVVTAASGSVGQLMVQLAHRRGARVVAASSTPDKQAATVELGAEVGVGYGTALREAVDRVTDGRGVDVVLDAVGAPAWDDVLAVTATRGLIVSVGSVGGPLPPIEPMQLAEAGSLMFTRPRLADFVGTPEAMRARGGDVLQAIAEGTLDRRIEQVLPLERFAEGYAALEERRAVGKSVLRIGG